MDKKKLRALMLFGLMVVGDFGYALTVTVFLLPAHLASGGGTGIAIASNYMFGTSISLILFLINLIMLVLGYLTLGGLFASTTLASTFLIPLFIELCGRVLQNFVLTEDIFLCALFSGLGIGISLGLVIRVGGSTGGMDIPPLMLNKYFRAPVSVTMTMMDVCILLLQAPFQEAENILYGILMVVISTITLDRVILIGKNKTEVRIVSRKTEEIRDAILSRVDRGVTLLEGETGYLHRKTKVLLSVISNRELVKLEKIIHDIDPESFMVISRVSEVRGRGFTMEKRFGGLRAAGYPK